ncbi:MAG: sugar ABC transporter ATP-binding protein [Planctomycetota bacterium]
MDDVAPPLLEVRNISKRFPGVRALGDVNLTLGTGEVLAVIGENGAGKSTLMKILAGVQLPDRGNVLIDGDEVTLDSVATALQCGVALIHQELNLAENLPVGANIFLGREPRRFGIIDRRRIHDDAQRVLQQIGLEVDANDALSNLSIGQKQLVEIAKAVSVNARVLIMDEPTSSLSAGEAERLFQVVKDLRESGVSIIYISHRLGEVSELADRVTVLRDGENAGDLEKEAINHDNMVRLMVGRDISQFYARQTHPIGDVVLQVEGLRTPTWPRHELSFSLRAGEIVGVAGLVGAGRTEMLRTLFGVDEPVGGNVLIDGKSVQLDSPRSAINAGIALVPEDRKQHGLVIDMSVRRNVSLAGLLKNRLSIGLLNRRVEKSDSDRMIRDLRIKTPSDAQIVRFLSGGNQQKVVLGKWLAMEPRILLLDEPTRGIDIGAKQEIYQLMEALAEQGMAILFVSSELEEVLGMSDRAIVMHEGKMTGELSRSELSEESIMQLATGNLNAEESTTTS